MKEQPILGYDWEMGHEEIKLEIGTYYILRERYLTISVHKKNIDEARTYFARVGTDITTHLAKLSSIGEELDAGERLKIFRDFFKEDVSATAEFDFKEAVKRGHDFKDWFAPDSIFTKWKAISMPQKNKEIL